MRKYLILTMSVMALMTVIACQNKPVVEDQDTLSMESSLNSEPELTSTDVAMSDTSESPSATPSTYESLGASSSGLGR